MTWRDVKSDPPPRDGARLILYCPEMAGPKEAFARWDKIGPRDGFPWEDDSGSRIAEDQPTHWREIPLPPEAS